jgi:pSer/pThr/pTyr-binding forkhead associated (FHA) protein
MYIVVVEDERGALIHESPITERGLTFGRTPENDITLTGTEISRQHARIFVSEGEVYVEDLESANGVLVDDQRIRGSTPVIDRNRIRIGEFYLRIEHVETRPAGTPGGGISTAVVMPEDAHGKLLVISGPHAGREQRLFEPITSVGRTEENDFTVPDISVSRHHARLKLVEAGRYTLTDLNSINGTQLNGRRISGGVRARHGDRIQFGNIECVLVDGDGKGVGRRTAQKVTTLALLVLAAGVIGALAAVLMFK